MTDEQMQQLINVIKQAHNNNVDMVVLLDGGSPATTTANLALHVQQALRAVLPTATNVIITPGESSMFVKLESATEVRTYGITSLPRFDALVRETHEPLEAANPAFKGNPMYLFGVAIEKVLNDHFLVYSGAPKVSQ
jgi:hypothetical protein